MTTKGLSGQVCLTAVPGTDGQSYTSSVKEWVES